MTTKLLNTLGTVEPDNLVVGTDPALRTGNALLRKNSGELKRGTVLAKSSKDATLVILGTEASDDTGGETFEAYGILADDITVPVDEDVNAVIYIGGKFNSRRIVVKSGYNITEADKDTLRKYGIEFSAADTN